MADQAAARLTGRKRRGWAQETTHSGPGRARSIISRARMQRYAVAFAIRVLGDVTVDAHTWPGFPPARRAGQAGLVTLACGGPSTGEIVAGWPWCPGRNGVGAADHRIRASGDARDQVVVRVAELEEPGQLSLVTTWAAVT